MINEEIKKKLVLALDVEDIEVAKKLVDELSPYIGTFKVGLQLFCGYGLEIVNYIKEKNSDFFLDVKLHDIPNTVEKASYNVIKNGANFFNVHATGGIEMMKAAKKGALEAAQKYGKKKPLVLAVTVLTSINQQTLTNELSNTKSVEDFVIQLAKNAKLAGLDGVVASAKELKAIKKELGEDFIVLTPGIRPAWSATNDQQRIATPSGAIKDGADFIVLGRAVTSAENKIEAIEKIYKEIQGENI
ncbi:MAG: orotidine-5'-phosphate decarboxylase [Candidatus Gastranaerophilales bacterium]|nr:orotidine-5'-phosphate decarboxylase [Candidatus Gastranaerophilales bacterium]